MEITAGMVNELRRETGLPMMDCKKALVESAGDKEKAVEALRKAGAGRVEKLAGRETSQGRIGSYVDAANRRGGIVELRCETAPVANTDDFMKLTGMLARQASAALEPTAQSLPNEHFLDDSSRKVSEVLHEAFNRLRENMILARVGKLTGDVGTYIHHNGQVGVLVEMSTDCPDSVKTDVCMHIAAMKPMCTRREEVDAALVEKERVLAAEAAKGKPANIIGKIVDGKLDKWYGEICLLEQPFVKDDKKTVSQMLKGINHSLTVNRYIRYEVGGG